DGQLRPAELIALAEKQKLAAIALTDHDTVAGLAEAKAAARSVGSIEFITGVELSAKTNFRIMHILGLGIDETSPAIIDLCRQLRDARDDRNPKILAKLARMGIDITMDEVYQAAGVDKNDCEHAVISRMHIAEVMRKNSRVRSITEAFDKYIGSGCEAYVDKERLFPEEVISAIHKSGGLAVLAHPALLGCFNSSQFIRVLRNLIHHNLDGIEVYHSSHSPIQTRHYLDLARKYNLLVTGGSDFHGCGKPNVKLGYPRVPLAALGDKRHMLLPNPKSQL
ncbi:MAG: hypothetical protein DRI65_17780, partial [Chloroflexota bacterium]